LTPLRDLGSYDDFTSEGVGLTAIDSTPLLIENTLASTAEVGPQAGFIDQEVVVGSVSPFGAQLIAGCQAPPDPRVDDKLVKVPLKVCLGVVAIRVCFLKGLEREQRGLGSGGCRVRGAAPSCPSNGRPAPTPTSAPLPAPERGRTQASPATRPGLPQQEGPGDPLGRAGAGSALHGMRAGSAHAVAGLRLAGAAGRHHLPPGAG